MKGLKVSVVIAVVMVSFAANGQRTCLEGCQDGNRVSVNFNPRAAQSLFDSLFFRLDSLTAYIEACGGGGAGTDESSSGGGSSNYSCGSPFLFDGYEYSTVQIGDQCWFAENLRTTQYADGSAIPEVTDDTAWASTNDGARSVYNNDAGNLTTYGYLYNFYAVESTSGLCPTGWHVATDPEWTTLTDHLGGESAAGEAMKSSASDTPSWDGTNSSGFSALPGGLRSGTTGASLFEGGNGSWWTALPSDSTVVWFRNMGSAWSGVGRQGPSSLRLGFSVRCVGDAAAGSSSSAPTVSSAAASDLAETTATLSGTVDADGGDAVTATGFVWGTDALLSGASNASGSATSGSFTASLTGLTGGTTYYFSAYATNGEGTAFGDTLSFTTTPAAAAFTCGTSTVTFDGHAYSTVEIGTQCWFAENLRTTQYADGSAIPEVTDGTAWASTNDGACAAYNNDFNNLATYGYLYNWYAVDSAAGLCPSGWHVPTDEEWTTLTSHLGGQSVAGEAMKSSAPDTPSWNGTNSSGFSALPGGIRDDGGIFDVVGNNGYWWSASPFFGIYAWLRTLNSDSGDVNRNVNDLRAGVSVRCIQDTSGVGASLPTVSSGTSSSVTETTATLSGTVDADGGDAVTATGFVWGTDALLSGASNASGSATSGSFTASLTGLTGGTTYYFSAYATNGEGTAHGDTLSFTTTPAAAGFTCGTSTVTFDGHAYSTVEIGTQCWFAENLRTTQYADGSAIPEVTDGTAWLGATNGARCTYGNNSVNLSSYGYLYNWHAVNEVAGLCPTGWHVPTDSEWTALTVSLGASAASDLKATSPEWDGTNASGFTGLPGGYRSYTNANFWLEGSAGFWWSASPTALGPNAIGRKISTSVSGTNDGRGGGFSVRCLRDE